MPGFRQILLVLGVIFLFRIIGKVMSARRNINEQKAYHHRKKDSQNHKTDIGKTSISKVDKKTLKNEDFSSYEEVE